MYETRKITRNLNEIVHSWIRLLMMFHLCVAIILLYVLDNKRFQGGAATFPPEQPPTDHRPPATTLATRSGRFSILENIQQKLIQTIFASFNFCGIGVTSILLRASPSHRSEYIVYIRIYFRVYIKYPYLAQCWGSV